MRRLAATHQTVGEGCSRNGLRRGKPLATHWGSLSLRSGHPPMSALFSPIKLRGLTLPNRIMVAPMCQYSADDGEANDWHFTHINSLALSGAAMFCIEATAVEAIGRITPGCLGLWNDATEAALKPILASVRKHSKTAVAMQLAHAGRKASSHTPWDGGQLIPLAEGGWQAGGPLGRAAQGGRDAAAARSMRRALTRVRDAFVAAAKRAERLGIDAHRGALRARLSAASVPVADLQPAHRSIWRLACRTACAFRSKCSTRCARRFRTTSRSASRVSGDRLGRGRLGPAADHRIRAGAEEARRRLDRRVLRRRVAAAKNSARPRLPGAVRAGDQGGDRRSPPSRSA